MHTHRVQQYNRILPKENFFFSSGSNCGYLTNIRFCFAFEMRKTKTLKYSLMAIIQLERDTIYGENECVGSVVLIARNNYTVTIC